MSGLCVVAVVICAAAAAESSRGAAGVHGAAAGRSWLWFVVLGPSVFVVPKAPILAVGCHGVASGRSLVDGISPVSSAGEGRGLENKGSKAFREMLLVVWAAVMRASVPR